MDRNKHLLRKRASSSREYQKRKASGLCVYEGCPTKPAVGRAHCPKHLTAMARNNRVRKKSRKAEGLCIQCGLGPQFWTVHCIICRQRVFRRKSPLPLGARRVLRVYREVEQKRELEQLRIQTRFAIRKLLATGRVTGNHAHALRLYAGLDHGGWRSNAQISKLMRISRERVRQLLYPSKVILTEMLEGKTPWPPLTTKLDLSEVQGDKRKVERRAIH